MEEIKFLIYHIDSFVIAIKYLEYASLKSAAIRWSERLKLSREEINVN